MQRAYRYRVYPTAVQAALLEQAFGCTRFVWNWALAEHHAHYASTGKSLQWSELSQRLTVLKQQPERVWLNDVSAWSLQQPLRNLKAAYEAFFAKRAKYPTFKSKRKARPSARWSNQTARVTERGIVLSKVGEVRAVWHRPIPEGSVINSVNVSRDAAGRYHAAVQVGAPDVPALSPNGVAVGVDVGLTSLLTLSTGEKVANPKHGARDRKALARAQQTLARKEKGSKNREKARRRVAKIHARIADRRADHLHKLSTRLVRENQTVVIEDLAVRNMVKNHALARAISDAAWSEFRRQLEYKAQWYGRTVIAVDRFYPSSKTCSVCGHLLTSLPLGVRAWTCPACQTSHDRDVNAARNLLAVGSTVTASGGCVRPDVAKATNGQRPMNEEAALSAADHVPCALLASGA